MRLILPPDQADREVTLLEAERFAEAQAKKTVLEELDVANEIFLAKNWSTVHYADLMDRVPDGTASKAMLISWLNDSTRQDRILRPGLITLYRRERPEHFPGGVWTARSLCEYIHYLAKKLTDPAYVGSRKAYLFRDSFCDSGWLLMAVAVCGLKLLEDCYVRGAMKSDMAKGYLRITFDARQRLEDTARIIGRCAKNHEVPPELYGELKEIAERGLKQALKTQLEISQNHKEHKIFERWEPAIRAALNAVSEEVACSLGVPGSAAEAGRLGLAAGGGERLLNAQSG